MHALLTIAYACLFSVIIYRNAFFRLSEINRFWIPVIFWLKIGAGILLWAVYNYHYSFRSDTFIYFDDAMVIRNLWSEDRDAFWKFLFGVGTDQPDMAYVHDRLRTWTKSYSYGLSYDGPTIVRFNLLISLFSGGYYHVHTVFMCFLSLIGLTGLFRAFSKIFLGREWMLFVACFMIPSVVFWSSGVLKEAPLIMALGILVYSIFGLLENHKRILYWVLLGCSLFILKFLKEYVIISMLPALLSLLVYRLIGRRRVLSVFLSVHVICFVISMNASSFFVGGNFLYVLNKKQTDFYNVTNLVEAKSGIDRIDISDYTHFFMGYPKALGNTYLRPHILEMKTVFYWPVAIENLLFFVLIVVTLFRFRRPDRALLPALLFAFSFVVILGGIVGFTVPILGALIRYKIVALPFLAVCCFALIRPFSIPTFLWQSSDSKKQAEQLHPEAK